MDRFPILKPEPGESGNRGSLALIAVARVVVPGAVLLGGMALIALGHGVFGVMVMAIVPLVVAVNWLARLSLRSGSDREREEAARSEFRRTGRWPAER